MTTIAVVKKNGVAAIAADTLTKWGTGKESAAYIANNDKLVRAGDSYLAAAGSATFKFMRDYFAQPKFKARFAIEAAAEFDDATGLPVISQAVKLKRR